MANFEIPKNPEYSEKVRKFEEEDPGHADLFNAVVETLLGNEVFLKKLADSLARRISGLNTLTKYTTVQTPNPTIGPQIIQKESEIFDFDGNPEPFPIQEVVAGHEAALRQLNTDTKMLPAINGKKQKLKVCAGSVSVQFDSNAHAQITLPETFTFGVPVFNLMSAEADIANSNVTGNILTLVYFASYANAQVYVKYIVIGY